MSFIEVFLVVMAFMLVLIWGVYLTASQSYFENKNEREVRKINVRLDWLEKKKRTETLSGMLSNEQKEQLSKIHRAWIYAWLDEQEDNDDDDCDFM